MKTLYVMRPVTNAEEIVAWAKKNKFINISKPSDIHVTVAYSKKKVEWNTLSKPKDRITVFNKERTIKVLGEATVLSFQSKALQDRWQYFKDNGASWDYDTYTPHLSISYVKQHIQLKDIHPYIGDILLGPEVWEELDEDWEKGK